MNIKLAIFFRLGVIALITLNPALGHIDDLKFNGVIVATANSSKPGGEVFAPDQKVTVAWEVTIAHTVATTYISYSTNGNTWVQVTTFPGNTNNLGFKTYSWTIPNLNSNKVQLRVYQAYMPNSNPVNTVSDDYNLVSGNFTIQPKSMGIAGKRSLNLNPDKNRAIYSVDGAQISIGKLMPEANKFQIIIGK